MGLADPGGHHTVLWGSYWCVGLWAGGCRAVCWHEGYGSKKESELCRAEGLRVLSVMVSPPALAQLAPFGSCRLLLPALSLWELQGALPPLLLQCLQPEV